MIGYLVLGFDLKIQLYVVDILLNYWLSDTYIQQT